MSTSRPNHGTEAQREDNWRAQLHTCLQNACESSIYFSVAMIPKPLKSPGSFVCGDCGSSWASRQELAAHRFKSHGSKNPIRRICIGVTCLFCLKCFHTRNKLLNHVSYRSFACRKYYLDNIPPYPDDIIAQQDEEESRAVRALRLEGRSPLYHPVPAFRIQGPRPPLIH